MLSIIAVQQGYKYLSIQCHHDEGADLLYRLSQRKDTIAGAAQFVLRGDMEITKKCGLLLKQSPPAQHNSPLEIASYAVSSNATDMYVFEDDVWNRIPLEKVVSYENIA